MGRGIQDHVKAYLSKRKTKHDSGGGRFTGTNWFLSACSYPKTPSFAVARRQPPRLEGRDLDLPRAATLSDVDRFLYENFNSLYVEAHDVDASDQVEEGEIWPTGSPDYPVDPLLIPRSSHRFFVDPGLSNSIVEDTRPGSMSSTTLSGPSDAEGIGVPEESVAVMTFSKDPYEDFLRSMLEMVEARHPDDDPSQPLDWDFMEDLLLCYLELNDRTVHKHILGAFTDLTVSLRRQAGKHKKLPEI